MAVTIGEFRNGMSRLASSVSVVTTDGPAGRSGFTVSSICSVTDDPPILLICVNRSSDRNSDLKQNGKLCVNVLAAEHQPVSEIFSDRNKKSDERFLQGDWVPGEGGCPVLQNAVVAMECEIAKEMEEGTHTVFFCRVTSVLLGAKDEASLLYSGRRYHRFGAQA